MGALLDASEAALIAALPGVEGAATIGADAAIAGVEAAIVAASLACGAATTAVFTNGED